MFAMNAVASKQHQIAEPRFDHYEDTGCEVASTCFDCPLPRCKFDDMEWFYKYRRLGRYLHMATVIQNEGLTVPEAAERFSITERTVFRVLRRCQDAMRELTPAEAAVFASLAVWPPRTKRAN